MTNEEVVLEIHGRNPFRAMFHPKTDVEQKNRKNLKAIAPVLVLALVAQTFRASRDGGSGIWVVGGTVVVVLGLILLFSVSRRIVVTPTEVVCRGLVFSKRAARARIARTFLQSIEVQGTYGSTTHDRVLLVLDTNGNCLARASETTYGADDVERLRTALNITTEANDDELTINDLYKKYPGSYPWWMAHPIATGLFIAAVIIAAIAIPAVIFGG